MRPALPDRRHRRRQDRRDPRAACARAPNARGAPARSRSSSPARAAGLPDHEALLAAIPAMSLMDTRRYLLADGVERWRDKQLDAVAAALGDAAARPHRGPDRPRQGAGEAARKRSRAPTARSTSSRRRKPASMPRVLVADAQRLGFRLDPAAARLLVDRMGASPVRLQQRARAARALGRGGRRGQRRRPRGDDRRHLRSGRLDALRRPARARRPHGALRLGERLIAQGENVTGLIYGLASRLRAACAAAAQLEEGTPPHAGRVVAEDAPLRGQAAGRPPARRRPRRPADGDRDARRPRASGAAAAPTTATSSRSPSRSGGQRRIAGTSGGSELTYSAAAAAWRAALDFLRAPVFLCMAPFWTALSIFETSVALLARRSPRRRRASIALSRRRKWVFTVLVSRRFSVRSRSLRRIRFFCEAMLAMSSVPGRRRPGSGRPPTIATENDSLETPEAPDTPDPRRARDQRRRRRRARPRRSTPSEEFGASRLRGRQARPHRPLDRLLLDRHRRLAHRRPRPRGRRRRLLRRQRPDVGVHDRLPGPQPGPRAVRRRRPAAGLRPGLHRAARAEATTARPSVSPRPCCCWSTMVLGALTALFVLARAGDHAALRARLLEGAAPRPDGHALPGPLPDPDPARDRAASSSASSTATTASAPSRSRRSSGT